jgi:hypothetical protein
MCRHLAVIVLALLGGGCSTDGWNRFFYGLGDQYACSARNTGRIDRVGRDADCLNPAGEGRTRYADYRDQRDAARAAP